METIIKYRLFIILVVVMLALVFVRLFINSGFRNNTDKWAASSFTHENIITWDQYKDLSGDILLIDLNKPITDSSIIPKGTVHFSISDFMDKNHQKMIHQHSGPVVLYAIDVSLSSKVWMLLSQTGKSQLYVLVDSLNGETLKYKFRPDTLIKPE
jgi:hypothetical protein